MQIPVGHGKFALVDDEDYPYLSQFRWHNNGWGYAQHSWCEGKQTFNISMHRMILTLPDGKQTDHIDGNRLNNQRSNLRPCTASENNQNRRAWGASPYMGVSWSKRARKWQVRIKAQRKQTHLGYFDTEEGAARAYDASARELFGQFARLNFPEE